MFVFLTKVSGKTRANEFTVRAHCYRSMKKAEAPHQLRVGHVKMTLFKVCHVQSSVEHVSKVCSDIGFTTMV